MSENHGETLCLYVGTYTTGESEGIYVYRVNPITGALELSSTTEAGKILLSWLSILNSDIFTLSTKLASLEVNRAGA